MSLCSPEAESKSRSTYTSRSAVRRRLKRLEKREGIREAKIDMLQQELQEMQPIANPSKNLRPSNFTYLTPFRQATMAGGSKRKEYCELPSMLMGGVVFVVGLGSAAFDSMTFLQFNNSKLRKPNS